MREEEAEKWLTVLKEGEEGKEGKGRKRLRRQKYDGRGDHGKGKAR